MAARGKASASRTSTLGVILGNMHAGDFCPGERCRVFESGRLLSAADALAAWCADG
jgi:hypothetical protein